MPYTIVYGPRSKRVTVTGLKLAQIAAKADELIASGAVNVQILRPDGKPTELSQFKQDVLS